MQSINLPISQEAYNSYLEENDQITNRRIRPESESFIDAMLSVDMAATPERREVLEVIRKL